jgi:molecular chaperone GrpE
MAKRKQPDSPPHKRANLPDLEERIEELTNALRQERADIINLRRRYDEQMASIRAGVKSSVVAELLPVIDNFERAMKHVPKELQSSDYVKGIEQIAKQFDKALQDLGVSRIETVGQEFNPNYHEAVMVEEGSGNKEIVSEEVLAGYRLGDEVIRHALVKVQPR